MKFFIYSFLLILNTFSLISKDEPKKPNVVFFLVDDLGIKDLSCYGSDFHESPNIDSLAEESIRYTNAYAAHPVCGPSRTAIVTGKFPARLGLTKIAGAIPKGEVIWPQVLKDKGYATYFLGKWHLGNAQSVLDNGFDVNIAGAKLGQPANFYFPYKGTPKSQNVPGMEDGEAGDYLTDALTDKALKLLDNNGDKPFLLYFSYYNVHKPAVSNAQGKIEHVNYFKDKLKRIPLKEVSHRIDKKGGYSVDSVPAQRNAEFAGQIKALDDSVGRILTKLEELGIADNTIIIFTSDQGSMCTSKIGVSSAAPYRFGKAFVFEGGIRVPLIIKWPSQLKSALVNDSITINTDLYPTILDMLDLPLNEVQHQDGISITATFKDKTLPFNRAFYWTYPHNHSLGHKASLAVRRGPYKLIYWPGSGMSELYDVNKDISESHDISKQKPEITSKLMKLLNKWESYSKPLDSSRK